MGSDSGVKVSCELPVRSVGKKMSDSERASDDLTPSDKDEGTTRLATLEKTIGIMAGQISELSRKRRRSAEADEAQVPAKVPRLGEISRAPSEDAPFQADLASLVDYEVEDDEYDGFLQDLLGEDEIRKTGPAIGDKLAKVIAARYGGPAMPPDSLKEKLEAAVPPVNCPTLATPRVNVEIWEGLSNFHKKQDFTMMQSQKAITAAAISISLVAEELINQKAPSELIKSCVGAISLLGHASRESSVQRRQLLRPALNKEYSSLCASSAEMTPLLLFGDDLAKRQRDVLSTNKFSRLTRPATVRPYRGTYRGSYGSPAPARGAYRRPTFGGGASQQRFLDRGSRTPWRSRGRGMRR